MNHRTMLGALAALLVAGSLLTSGVRPLRAAVSRTSTYLPAITTTNSTPIPLPGGPLPAVLSGRWFTGTVPPTDFYDPVSGQWRDTAGLGQLYEFTSAGGYSYTGFLRIQNGQCRSEVSTYQQGGARVSGQTLNLMPRIAKTRTVVICGSRTDVTTDGPFTTRALDWSHGLDNVGVEQLALTDGTAATIFRRQGMAQQLVGGWHRGPVLANGFYDPATQVFADQQEPGGWYQFSADGRYRAGEYDTSTNQQGCALRGWVYQEGTVSVAGGQITLTPQRGVARVENACTPDTPQQQPYVGAAENYAWLFRDLKSAAKLVLIPLGMFREYVYECEA